MTIPRKHSAVALFSGGLDSILAVKWMQKLGYIVHSVFFSTPYLMPDKALKMAQANDIDLIVRDITNEHLEIVQHPKYGYGKNYNPCIDCRALMFRLAGQMLDELGASFIISGEVVGQRPMSQRFQALMQVSKGSEMQDLIVRPLSQKLLPDSKPILEGWVNKEKMLDLQGRGRTLQMELAKSLGITEYPSPGGGCLLTDRSFTLRLRDLIAHNQYNPFQIELLKWGRHFRLSPTLKLIVGRHKDDNYGLDQAAKDLPRMQIQDVPGPLGVLTAPEATEEELRLAASILLSYCNKAPDPANVIYSIDSIESSQIMAHKRSKDDLAQYLISIE